MEQVIWSMQLKIENLHKSFEEKEVLKGIDFTFGQCEKFYGKLGTLEEKILR